MCNQVKSCTKQADLISIKVSDSSPIKSSPNQLIQAEHLYDYDM